MSVGRAGERGRRRGPGATRSRLVRAVGLLLLVSVTASCAYYNTFYLAKKYYMKATNGEPYEVDRDGTTQRANYNKSADYSKKLLGVYPKSKYVDDAWLMWARALVGTDDPLKAVAMLEEFETRFPKSNLRPDAEFFLGLAYRQAHKHEQAVAAFDEFLAQAPRHVLVPYAFYERSKSFMSLERYREAAESAGQVLEHFPKHVIADKALRQRAEARYQQHDWAGARADFHVIGDRALTDDERLRSLLREVDCLESSHNYEEARSLLRDARSHVPIPPPLPVMPRVGVGSAAPGTPGAPPTNQPPVSVVRTPAEEQYGRLTLRMGDVELLDSHVDRAVELYRSVLQDYPRSQLSAEAQYRIGYAYETGSDDFERARAEYAHVKEQAGMSQFSQQAQARLDNLDRIDRYRTAAGADSLARKAEGRFLVAEHYLFSLERPERALEEYRSIYDSSTTASVRARALNAEAWLLSRKLDRKPAADSLFWQVVRDYPATEGQLAARDYLEAEGHLVPDSLIVAPKDTSRSAVESGPPLTQPPSGTPHLGAGSEAGYVAAGASVHGANGTPLGAPPPGPNVGTGEQWRSSTQTDSLQRAAEGGQAAGVVVAPGSGTAPSLSAGDTLASTRHAPSAPATPAPHSATAGAAGAAVATGVVAGTSAGAAGGAAAVTGAAAVPAPAPPPAPHVDSPAAVQPGAAASGTPAGARLTSGPPDSTSHAATAVVADTTRHTPPAASDSTRYAVRSDSLHKSAISPKRVVAAPVVAAPVVPPVENHSKSIVSWDQDSGPKLTKAQRDSVHRAEKARKDAKRDAQKREAATRDSLKHAAKAPKSAAAAPDSTRGQDK